MAGAVIGAIIGGGAKLAGSALFGKTFLASVLTGASLGHSLENRGGHPMNPASPTYDFESLGNTNSPVVPIPVIYGRNKVAGNVIYHRVSDDDKRLYYAVGIGEGPVQGISDIRINDRPIEETGDSVIKVTGAPPIVSGRAQAQVRSRQGFPGGLTITWRFDILYREVGKGVWINGGEKVVTGSVGNVTWGDEYRTKDSDWSHALTGLSGDYEVRVEQKSVSLSNGNWELWGDRHRSDISPSWEWYTGTADQAPSMWVHTNEHFRNTAYLAFHFRDAGETGGRAPTITSITDGLLIPVWSGTQWITEYSRNPAWCVLDYLRSSRYGIGIPDYRIDLESFKSAAEYCDELIDDGKGGVEPRFRLDYVMDNERSSLDVVDSMLATFRGFIPYSDGQLRLRIERYEPPVYAFNDDNIVEGSFAYSYASLKDIPNQIRVEFIDPDSEFERTEVVYDNEPDQARRGEVVSRTLSLVGISRASQAGREARFIHDSAYRANVFCEFQVGIDALHVEVGDVVKVTHEVAGWDDKAFRVLEVEELEEGKATLRLREYSPAIYHDKGVPYQDSRGTTLPNPLAPPPHVTSLTLENATRTLGDGSVVPAIRVTWIAPIAAYYAGAIVYWRKAGGVWEQSPLSEVSSYDILLAEPSEYEVRVVSQSRNGLRAPFDSAPEARLNVSGIIPPTVTGLRVDFTGSDAVATWQPVAHINKYRVRIASATDNIMRTTVITGTEYTYRFAENVTDFRFPNPEIKISVEAVNEAGNYSIPTILLAVNEKPSVPTAVAESSMTQLRWQLTSALPSDFQNVVVRYGSSVKRITSTSDVVDLRIAGIDDGDEVAVYISIADVFGQESDARIVEVSAIYATEADLAGSIFGVEYSSAQFPNGADPAVLYDGDPMTGITFAQAPTILASHPKEERFGMVSLHVGTAVKGYVQVRRHGEEAWRNVIGTPASPHSFSAGENVVAFVKNHIVVAREVRIVLLSAVRVNEFVPSVYLVANHFIGGTMRLTQGLRIESGDGSTVIGDDGLTVDRGTPASGRMELRGTTLRFSKGSFESELSPEGLVFLKDGLLYNYVARIETGEAFDGDTISLDFAAEPKITMMPTSLPTYDPSQPATVQAIAVRPVNIRREGSLWKFDMICRLNQYGQKTSSAVNQNRSLGQNWSSSPSDPATHSTVGIGISADFRASVHTPYGFPGSTSVEWGYRVRLRKNGGAWQNHSFIASAGSNNPWTGPFSQGVSRSVLHWFDVDIGSWEVQIAYDTVRRTNTNWTLQSDHMRVLAWEHESGKLFRKGHAIWVAIDGGV